MSRKLLDISLAIFIITCAITIWIGIFTAKAALDHYILMAKETKQAQEEIIKAGKEVREILLEAGFAAAVIALSQERIIPPTDAEKMISESVEKIGKHSEKLGILAKYINDHRIEQERRR